MGRASPWRQGGVNPSGGSAWKVTPANPDTMVPIGYFCIQWEP